MGTTQQITELLKESQNFTEINEKGQNDGSEPDKQAGQDADSGILSGEEGASTDEEGEGDTGGDTGSVQNEEETPAEEVTAERAALDAEKEAVNNQAIQNMNDRHQIDAIIELLGDKVPAEISETYKQIHNAYIERELQILSRVLPKWENPKTAEYEQGLIIGMARKYGVSRSELETLIQDHRLVKMLRDAALTQDWKAKHQTKAARAAPRRAPGHQDAIKRGTAPNATKQDKLQAINSLLT